jgi:cytochrome c-type biogenesis protein CcmE
MTRKQRRLVLIGSALSVVAVAVGLVLWGLSGNIAFFNSPTDVVERGVSPGQKFRLGGLVQEGSVERGADQVVHFTVTDGRSTIRVRYQGILPDLFREKQGVVTEGRLDASGIFRADTVLARHDENYMPREVADALRRQGHFIGEEGRAAAPRPGGGS